MPGPHERRVYTFSERASSLDRMKQNECAWMTLGLGGLSLTDLPGVDAWLKGAVEGESAPTGERTK